MTIIYTDDTGPLVLTSSDTHDPNSSKYYYLNYRPGTRIPAKEYVKGVDIVTVSYTHLTLPTICSV